MFGEVIMSYEELEYFDGSFRREWKNGAGKLHREDGPAVICYYPDGSIKQEYFYINGKSHREFGPADIYYDSKGSVMLEFFYLNEDFLGYDKKGFWALWSRLTDDKRNNLEILKCLARFS
jgi:antitoxin component YwqK of YwqJK toxin-antitoxin module